MSASDKHRSRPTDAIRIRSRSSSPSHSVEAPSASVTSTSAAWVSSADSWVAR